MALSFEWDDAKAKSNLAKHEVSLEEACTVFGDSLSLTIPDPAHSLVEDRFIIMGLSHRRNFWLLSTWNGVIIFALSVPDAQAGGSARVMKKASDQSVEPELRDEYDFSDGVRGKHAERYERGTNVVVIEADVAKVFPNSEAVNESLRALAGIIQRQGKPRAVK